MLLLKLSTLTQLDRGDLRADQVRLAVVRNIILEVIKQKQHCGVPNSDLRGFMSEDAIKDPCLALQVKHSLDL